MLKQKQGRHSILSRESSQTMIWVAVLIFAFADLAIGVPQNSISASYGFVSLDVPAPNGQLGFTILDDIADNGDLLSEAIAAGPQSFLLKQLGIIPILCSAQAEFTGLGGINNGGEIAGRCIFGSGQPSTQGFLRSANGEFVFFNFPGAIATSPFQLNDHSEVVGFYRDSNGSHGFVWSSGLFQTIDVPHNLGRTFARGINNLGQVVGDYLDSSGQSHGFIHYPDGSFGPIDFPGAQTTIPTDINDDSQIVGDYTDNQGRLHGFLLKSGLFFTLDVPFPSTRTGISGINQKGQIVGDYRDSGTSNSHGFVATPK
jgi:probable HAF family extracellular repeat protein